MLALSREQTEAESDYLIFDLRRVAHPPLVTFWTSVVIVQADTAHLQEVLHDEFPSLSPALEAFAGCSRFDYDFAPGRCTLVTVIGRPRLPLRPGFLSDRLRYVRRGGRTRATTSTTTPVSAGVPCLTSTSTTTAMPANDRVPHPCEALDHCAVNFHICTPLGDVASSRLRYNGYLADVMATLCHCLQQKKLIDGTETYQAHPQVHFCELGVSVFICSTRPSAEGHCWVWAPQLLMAPIAIRCGDSISRGRLFRHASLTDSPGLLVRHNGIIRHEHVLARPGEVILISTADYPLHSAPLLNLLHRISDIQALLFPVHKLTPSIAQDRARLWGFWCDAVNRAQGLLGLNRPGARATLATVSCPPITIGTGTLLLPLTKDVQSHYDRFLAEHFGHILFQDTARLDRDFALLTERWQHPEHRLWIISLPSGIDVITGPHDGDFLRNEPFGEGWFVQPTCHAGWCGVAIVTRRTEHIPIQVEPSRFTPGMSESESSVPEFDAQNYRPTEEEAQEFRQWLRRDIWRTFEAGVPVHANPPTPDAAFPSGKPPYDVERRSPERVPVEDVRQIWGPLSTVLDDDTLSEAISISSVDEGSSSSSSSSSPSSTVLLQTAVRLERFARGAQKTRLSVRDAATKPVTQQSEVVLRALPTPCRTRRTAPLEQADANGPSDANGAVETTPPDEIPQGGAREGFAPAPAPDSPAEEENGCKTLLRLAELIEVDVPETSCEVHTGASLEDLLEALQPFQPALLDQTTFATPGLHVAAKDWLSHLPLWDRREALEHLSLFTDGSFHPPSGQASWAVVVSGRCASGEVYVGHVADLLRQPSDPIHLGNATIDAHAAELAALFIAMAIAAGQDGCNCDFQGDCTSALDIAGCLAQAHQQYLLATYVLDLHLVARLRRNVLTFNHVASHRGVPGNECADSVAKAVIFQEESVPPRCDKLCAMAKSRQLAWSWWTVSDHVTHGSLPGVDEHGMMLPDQYPPLARFHACRTIPGVPAQVTVQHQPSSEHADWLVRAATYNANSLRLEADRQMLDATLWECGVHVAGFQETRHFISARSRTAHYHCFSSPDRSGNFGCQIWVTTSLPLADCGERGSAHFNIHTALILHSSERIMAVCIEAGSLLFGLVSAHAPTSAATDEERIAWWDSLAGVLRKLPKRAIPVLLLDANARFVARQRADTVHSAEPVGHNSQLLRNFCADTELCLSPFFTPAGERIVTWVSPLGKASHIDYILWPVHFADCVVAHGHPWCGQWDNGVDHKPQICDVSWRQPTVPTPPRPFWDRERMATAAGKRQIETLFKTVPQVPWTFDVDDHVQLINNHLYAGMMCHFQCTPARARQQHISPQQWEVILQRRYVRRLSARSRCLRLKEVMFGCFVAWRRQAGQRPPLLASCRRRTAALLHEAKLALHIRRLNKEIRSLAMEDTAAFVRDTLKHAKDRGPSELFHAMRGVLKAGRRYKAPLVLPAIRDGGSVISDPTEVRTALTQHFAEPEHGTDKSLPDIADLRLAPANTAASISLPGGVSLSEVILGFLSLQDGKAPGISGLPAELFKIAAPDAAICLAPLLVKTFTRHKWAMSWRGMLAVAIPKPSKDCTKLQSWRSIALAEAAFKGVGRALRRHLARGLSRITTPGQGGSLPGEQIGEPSHHVMAHLSKALHCNESTAIVFVDGRAAYYATLREHLFTHDSDSPEDLDLLLQTLVPDPDLRDQVTASLLGPGLLQQADLHPSLEAYLRAYMSGTWFTLSSHDQTAQATRSGTAPGSPLTDILFQFVQSKCIKGVMQDLAEAGIGVRCAGVDAVFPQSWADDVALLLPLTSAGSLEPMLQQAVASIDNRSRLAGIDLNYDAGKTEILLSLRGKGSTSVKRRLLSVDTPVMPVVLANGATVEVRLVESYQHLGNQVTQAASCLEDIRAKSRAACIVMQRLQKTLLRNPALAPPEKADLVSSLVISKLRYGAGLWHPRTNAEEHALFSAFSRPWRSACRAICGCSSKFLDETEVAALLRCLTTAEVIAIEQVRQLCVVLEAGPGYLWHCLVAAPLWLDQALHRLASIAAVLGERWGSGPAQVSTLDCLRPQMGAIRSALKRYRRHCLLKRQPLCDLVRAKAQNLADFEATGGIIVPAPSLASGRFQCSHCQKRFRTRASRASHCSTLHGITADVSVASGTACAVCLQEWWTTHRLREHLRRSHVCRTVYCEADIGPGQGHEIVGTKHHRAWRPPTRTCGPLPFWATLRPTGIRTQVSTEPVDEAEADVRASFHKLMRRHGHDGPSAWAAAAVDWLSNHCWQQDWLEPEHPALELLLLLGDIVEQVTTENPTEALCRGRVKALRQRSLWWISAN